MAIRTLPARTGTGIVYLSATTWLVTVYFNTVYSNVMYITTDSGATWNRVPYSGMIWGSSAAPSDPLNVHLLTDASGNMYYLNTTSGKIIVMAKGAGNTWSLSAFINDLTAYATNLDPRKSIAMFASDGRMYIDSAEIDATYGFMNLYRVVSGINDLTTWTKTGVISGSAGGGPTAQAATLAGGQHTSVYAYQPGAQNVYMAFAHNPLGFAAIPLAAGWTPSHTWWGTAGGFIGYMALAYTNDGKLHLFFNNKGQTSIMESTTTVASGTWTTPTAVASAANIIPSATSGKFGRFQAQTDGSTIILSWVENPSGGTFNIKSLRFDGTSWGTVTSYTGISDDATGFANPAPWLGRIPTGAIGTYMYRPLGSSTVNGIDQPVLVRELLNNYAPYQPSALTPSGGSAVGTLTPTVGWTFGDPNPGDVQSAYQIIVYRQSDSVQMYDSGKVTSAAASQVIPGGASLAYNVFYQFKVRTWDQDDVAGPYSSLSLFKTSAAPTTSITSPTEAQVIVTDTPTITWSYSDSESTPQTSARLVIYDSTGTTIIWDSGTVLGTATSMSVPKGYLINGSAYKAYITVVDGDGISGTSSVRNFSVSFLAPPTPSVTAVIEPATMATRLDVTLNDPATDSYMVESIKVYRKVYGGTFSVLQANVPIAKLSLDNMDAITGWTASGVGITPTRDASNFKEGTASLNLGATGAGTATYTKAISVGSITPYNKAMMWLFVTDKTKFTSITVKFGKDSSNYYSFTVTASTLTNGAWNLLSSTFNSLSVTGTPTQASLQYLSVVFNTVGSAIGIGTVKMDALRLYNTALTIRDYTTANGQTYIYGISAYNTEQFLESAIVNTSDLTVTFGANGYLNTYLVPISLEASTVAGWMNGDAIPNWTDNTETKYYQPKGASRPLVFVNAVQAYKEGKITLTFYDSKFAGNGLTGIDSLEAILAIKPILLRTWWGRNYVISIDGQLDVTRIPGIGWQAGFSFTEILT